MHFVFAAEMAGVRHGHLLDASGFWNHSLQCALRRGEARQKEEPGVNGFLLSS